MRTLLRDLDEAWSEEDRLPTILPITMAESPFRSLDDDDDDDDVAEDDREATPRGGSATGQVLTAVGWCWLSVVGALLAWSVLPVVAGWQPVLVTGASMAPAVRPGDVVLVDPDATVRPNMIVLAHDTRLDGQDVLHRVVSVNGDDSVTTRGDANATDDAGVVPAAEVGGAVRLVVPAAGRLALAVLDARHRVWHAGRPVPPTTPQDAAWLAVTALALLVVRPWRAGKRSR